MTRIPTAENLGLQTPTPSRTQSVVDTGAAQVFSGVKRLADIGADVAAEVNESRRRVKLGQATAEAEAELQEFVFDLKANDRDYDTQFERYETFTKEVSDRYKDQLNDNALHSAWSSNFNSSVLRHGFDVRKHSIDGQIDLQKAGITSTLSTLSELAVQGSDEQRQAIEEQAILTLADAYEGGVLSAQEVTNKRLKFQDEVVSALVRRDIINDPDQASLNLLSGKYKGLSSEQQQIWLERSNAESEARLRKEIAESERQHRLEQRALREIQDQTSKDGDQLLANGELTTDWINDNRENLSPDDYRYYYRQLTDPDQIETNIPLYSGLRIRASNGEDVRSEARSALHRNELTLGDYDKLVNRSERNVGISALPNSYKRGETHITRSLRVSDINPDPAAAQRQANALDDWQQWVSENPSATDSESRDAYKRIVSEYALIEHDQMLLTKRLPRFAVGARDNLDINATKRATAEAVHKGELTRAEGEVQIQLINEWDEAQKRLEAARQ